MLTLREGERISNYLLEARVGAGSFGEVWRARHHVFDDVVAIKIPTDPQYVRNLQREGVAIHGIRHPNIVRAIDLDPYADPPYYIMEYVDGPSLRMVIDQYAADFPVAAAEVILRGILQALAAAHDAGPIAFRFARGEGVGVELPERGEVLEIGKGRIVQRGGRVALLSFGTRLQEVCAAAEILSDKGISPTIADARFAKPLDRELILGLAESHEALITIEEGAVGGFGSHVAQLLAEAGALDHGLKFRSMVLPDVFIDQASPRAMYGVAGLNAADIVAKVLNVLGVAEIGAKRA